MPVRLFKGIIALALLTASTCDQKLLQEGSWQNCDRKRSRLARAILNEEFYPAVARMNFSIPVSCPLLQSNDIFLDNELVIIIYLQLSLII